MTYDQWLGLHGFGARVLIVIVGAMALSLLTGWAFARWDTRHQRACERRFG